MDKEQPNLFDPVRARGPREGPDVGKFADGKTRPEKPGQLTVSALLAKVKAALNGSFPLRLNVLGQISNFKLHSSGHLYFRLKDANAAIDAVMWRRDFKRLKFNPTDGLEVVASGRIDVYEIRGQLQLYVESMTPLGQGALELAFRQMKEKLQAEGLFDPAAKKAIPQYPQAIGVVTSKTGAALRDIYKTLSRRWPGATVYLFDSVVQGEGAAESIAQAIGLLDANAARYGIDTIIVSRGGGSGEDLWAFNEEPVARAVFSAKTPIISGVGHEVDITICDLVADVRAATPTAAAELAAPDKAQVGQYISQLDNQLARGLTQRLTLSRAHLDAIDRSAVFRDPTGRVRTQGQRIDEFSFRLKATAKQLISQARSRLEPQLLRLAAVTPQRHLERARARLDKLKSNLVWQLGIRTKDAGQAVAIAKARLQTSRPSQRLAQARQNLSAIERQLEAMGYKNVINRGFSVTRGPKGKILRSTAHVIFGEKIVTELADGNVISEVISPSGQASQTSKLPPESNPKTSPAQPGLFDNASVP